MNASTVKEFIANFGSDSEMTDDFLETLRSYKFLIESCNDTELAAKCPHLPDVLNETLNNEALCLHFDVCDLLADSFLSFISPETPEKQPEQSSRWAVSVLKKRSGSLTKDKSVEEESRQKKMFWKAVCDYPAEYLQSLSDEELEKVTLIRPTEIVAAIIDELLRRKMDVQSDLYELVDLDNASPSILLGYFRYFTEMPSIETATRIWKALETKPPLHLACARECLKYGQEAATNLLGMLGIAMKNSLPTKYPLWSYYHPAVKEIVEEIEAAMCDPEELDVDAFAIALERLSPQYTQYVTVLVREWPEWLQVIGRMDEEKEQWIHDAMAAGF